MLSTVCFLIIYLLVYNQKGYKVLWRNLSFKKGCKTKQLIHLNACRIEHGGFTERGAHAFCTGLNLVAAEFFALV